MPTSQSSFINSNAMNTDGTFSFLFDGNSSSKTVTLPHKLSKRLKQSQPVTREELEQKLQLADERRKVIYGSCCQNSLTIMCNALLTKSDQKLALYIYWQLHRKPLSQGWNESKRGKKLLESSATWQTH